jgi:K+-transporting ATPase KdpF subunit
VDDLSCSIFFSSLSLSSPLSSPRFICQPVTDGKLMIVDYALSGLVALGILFYLVFALLRPERF